LHVSLIKEKQAKKTINQASAQTIKQARKQPSKQTNKNKEDKQAIKRANK